MAEKPGGELPGANALLLLLARMDTNLDSSISREEVPPPLRPFFRQIENRIGGEPDGLLNRQELIAIAPQLSQVALNFARRLNIDVELELALLPHEQWKAVQKLADPKARPREILANPDQALATLSPIRRQQGRGGEHERGSRSHCRTIRKTPEPR